MSSKKETSGVSLEFFLELSVLAVALLIFASIGGIIYLFVAYPAIALSIPSVYIVLILMASVFFVIGVYSFNSTIAQPRERFALAMMTILIAIFVSEFSESGWILPLWLVVAFVIGAISTNTVQNSKIIEKWLNKKLAKPTKTL